MPHFSDVFISATTDEYGSLRKLLVDRLRAQGIRVDEQSDFARDGTMTLAMLENHVARSRIVVHLLGRTSHGATPSEGSVQRLKAGRAGDLQRLEAMFPGAAQPWFDAGELPRPSYTQWEALLALLLGKRLLLIDVTSVSESPTIAESLLRHRERLARFEQGRESRILRPRSLDEIATFVLSACSELARTDWEWPEEMVFDAEVLARDGFVGRKDLIQEIDSKLADLRRPMLIRAGYGVGKSSLMAYLAKRNYADTVSHFCVFSEKDTLDPRRIARSLASQLALRIERYRDMVEGSEELRAMIDSDNPVDVWLKGVIAPLRTLAERPVLLLIDALDESLEFVSASEDGSSLLELLVSNGAGTNPMPPWLRIIASARDISQLAPYAAGCEVVIDMEGRDRGHDEQNAQDIRTFLQKAVDDLPRLRDALAAAEGGLDLGMQRLVEACDGKFLLARMWKEEFHSPAFKPEDLLQDLNARVGRGTLLDMFYARTFARRVAEYPGMTRDMVRAVLGVLAVARDPLPRDAIAGVLQRPSENVQDVFDALRGLLVRKEGGVTFDSYSLRRWLDPTTRDGVDRANTEKAREYAIDIEGSTRAITAHCRRFATERDPLRAAGAFAPYLRRSGVSHLIDASDLPNALSLLNRLRKDAESDRDAAFEVRREELRAIEIIRHEVPQDSNRSLPSTLAGIPADLLLQLLTMRDYETGKFEPVLRLLLMCHFEVWQEIRQAIEHRDDGEDVALREGVKLKQDIVLRHDMGVALAEAWHASEAALSQRLMAEIVDLSRVKPGSALREVGGYAMKHVCQRRSGGLPWYRSVVCMVRDLLLELATSENATDRMVAGEAALALAIQQAPVLEWLPVAGQTASFGAPAWPNLACDIDAIRAILAAARPRPLLAAPPSSPEFDSCREQHLLREQLRKRLAASTLFRSEAGGRILDTYGSTLGQQNHSAALEEFTPAARPDGSTGSDDFIVEFERTLDDPRGRDIAYDFIRMLMLHPLWNETERASNLVASLLKPPDGRHRWWIIQQLLDEPASLWRLHYGAVDAAFTAGTRDSYATFLKAVLQVGPQPGANCRVRGICTDDLWAWLKDLPPRQRAERLVEPQLAGLLRHWLATADDHWQLEYLHRIFAELFVDADQQRDWDLLDRFGVPTGDDLSPFLRFDDQSFYELDLETFLMRIEQRAQAASRGPVG